MKWLGALLLVAAGAGVGYAKNAGLRRQINLLDELMAWIGYLEQEIGQRRTPLPELMRNYASRTHLPVLEWAGELEHGHSLRQAMMGWENQTEEETARIIVQLAAVLGKYDSETQTNACAVAAGQLAARKETLQRQLAEKGRLYQTVPLTLGLMAALVLL